MQVADHDDACRREMKAWDAHRALIRSVFPLSDAGTIPKDKEPRQADFLGLLPVPAPRPLELRA